jgi:hypothetical protein
MTEVVHQKYYGIEIVAGTITLIKWFIDTKDGILQLLEKWKVQPT